MTLTSYIFRLGLAVGSILEREVPNIMEARAENIASVCYEPETNKSLRPVLEKRRS